MSLPVTRPSGRALVVGSPTGRAEPVGTLQRMGYGCAEMEDPYAAMAELCHRPLVYRAVILSLGALHREELAIIPGVKRRFPHIDIWLTHTDGRQATLAEAMRLGADGLLSGEGLHRIAIPGTGPTQFTDAEPMAASPPARQEPVAPQPAPQGALAPPAQTPPAQQDLSGDDPGLGVPVLSADELRALLQEQPAPPAAGGNES